MRKELFVAAFIYFVTMFILLMAVYRFLENWQMSDFNFFVAGALVLLVAIGWGYVLMALIFAPKKKMEATLSTLSNEILHELNIPLSTIEANTAMLKKNLDDEKSLKRLRRIEDASVRLKRLYDELVYTIHKEMHDIVKERIDVADIVRERLDVFAEQKRNPFVCQMKPYAIEVDKIGFEQMFDNLISNAMKYAEKTTTIRVTLEEDTLCIIDKGVGMSTSELLRVHERYYQADEQQEGEGIGLSLVKAYCEDADIGLQIHSEKGVGTSIYLNLSKVHLTQN